MELRIILTEANFRQTQPCRWSDRQFRALSNIDDLTLAQIKQLATNPLTANASPRGPTPVLLSPGRKVFIRTVTLFFTGEIAAVTEREIALRSAAWIADTGRFADFLKNGPAPDCEIEPYPDGVVINREVIIAVSPWLHELPRTQR